MQEKYSREWNRDSRYRGSFTVEASLILPFVCFLLAVLLQTMLYLHDVSLFASAAYEAAGKGAELQDADSGQREAHAREQAEKLLAGRRLACTVSHAEVHTGSGRVRVKLTGSTGFLGGFTLQAEKEVMCINPVDFLRNVEKGRRLLK